MELFKKVMGGHCGLDYRNYLVGRIRRTREKPLEPLADDPRNPDNGSDDIGVRAWAEWCRAGCPPVDADDAPTDGHADQSHYAARMEACRE